MAKIEAEIIFDKAKAEIDTEFLALEEEAQLYPALFTADYLRYMAQDAFTSNATINVGDKVPSTHVHIPQSVSAHA